jgi:hypothetical protein
VLLSHVTPANVFLGNTTYTGVTELWNTYTQLPGALVGSMSRLWRI